MEGIVLVFIFVGVMAITALLFGAWLVFTLARFVLRGIAAIASPAPSRTALPPSAPQPPYQTVRCANDRCKHANPAIAQFCRRCGHALPSPQRVPVRRAAMW